MIGRESTQEYGGARDAILAQATRVAPAQWLSPAERDWFAELAGPRRRDDWLGGRWCVKTLVLALLSDRAQPVPRRQWLPRDITVISVNARGRSVPPTVYLDGQAQAIAVSIAHSARQIVAAIDPRPAVRLGIDVVDLGAPQALVNTWFTFRERAWLDQHRDPFGIPRIWSAKEACYKACHGSRTFDPRSIEVEVRSAFDGLARFAPAGDAVADPRAIGQRDTRTVPIRWRRTAHGLQAVAIFEELCR